MHASASFAPGACRAWDKCAKQWYTLSKESISKNPRTGLVAVAVLDVLGYKNFREIPEIKARVDQAIGLANMSVLYGSPPPLDSGMVLSAIFQTDSINITYAFDANPMLAEQFWTCLHFICHYLMEGGFVVRGGAALAHSPYDAYEIAQALEQTTGFPRIEFAKTHDEWDMLIPFEMKQDVSIPTRKRYYGLLRQMVREHDAPKSIVSGPVVQFDFLRFTFGLTMGEQDKASRSSCYGQVSPFCSKISVSTPQEGAMAAKAQRHMASIFGTRDTTTRLPYGIWR